MCLYNVVILLVTYPQLVNTPAAVCLFVQYDNYILNKLTFKLEGFLRILVKLTLCVFKIGVHFLTSCTLVKSENITESHGSLVDNRMCVIHFLPSTRLPIWTHDNIP